MSKEKQQIIELLCSSDEINIELAEQLCISQSIDFDDLLKEYGYWDIGITTKRNFTDKELYCEGWVSKKSRKLPNLLPNSIEHLMCGENRLKSLPKLPPNLKSLCCQENNLKFLPELPDTLEYLKVNDNRLTKLPQLPKMLDSLYFNNNFISIIPELPNSLINLECDNNRLANLPKLPSTLKTLYCNDNMFEITPEEIKMLVPENCYVSCDTLEKISKHQWSKEHNELLINLINKFDNNEISWKEVSKCFPNRSWYEIVVQFKKLTL